ncbi:MAG: methyl-accepting chemotaxis protein [Limnochordia bacterium]
MKRWGEMGLIRLGLRYKLLLGYCLVIAIMLAMAWTSFQALGDMSRAYSLAMEEQDQSLFFTAKEVDHLVWVTQLGEYLLGEGEFHGELDHTKCRLGEWYYQFVEKEGFADLAPELQQLFLALEEPHRRLHESARRVVSLVEQGDKERAIGHFFDQTRLHLMAVRGILDQIVEISAAQAKVWHQGAEKTVADTTKDLWTFAVVAAVLALLVAMFLSSRITRPINRVARVLGEISSRGGDLTQKLPVESRDEVGELSQAFNDFIENMHEMVLRVRRASENMVNSIGEIAAGNQDLSQRTQEQASALEEVAATLKQVTTAIEQMAANSQEGDNLSGETVAAVRKGDGAVREVSAAMDEIAGSSRQISSIINEVNEIAFRTNLLALNAAVEAARAGEHGKGFAVVAAEVRNLAGRTAESAKTIGDLITSSTVRVDRGARAVDHSREILDGIVLNSQKLGDLMGEIAAMLREQSSSAQQIQRAVDQLNEVTQQNAAMVEEIAAAGDSMRVESNELLDLVKEFKLIGDALQEGAYGSHS